MKRLLLASALIVAGCGRQDPCPHIESGYTRWQYGTSEFEDGAFYFEPHSKPCFLEFIYKTHGTIHWRYRCQK